MLGSRRISPRGRLGAALTLAAVAVAALPAAASGQGADGTNYVLGLELRAVDREARMVSAVQHCTSPDQAGQVATFAVAPEVDMGPMEPGHVVGAMIDGSTDPDTVLRLGPPPCQFSPGGAPGGDGFGPGPGPGGPGACQPPAGQPPSGPPAPSPARAEEQPGAACGAPDFARGFLSRVWKFVGEADAYEDGRLSMTVARILNLPRRFRTQDDEIVDEDATVLVGRARVYQDGRRVPKERLADAENVRVHGKLLPTGRWVEDEDGQPVTTIRAKKVYILD